MATTQVLLGPDQLKGPPAGQALHATVLPIQINGTYTNAARPSADLFVALQNNHEGVKDVQVKSVTAFGDYNDGTNVYTPANANIVLTNGGQAACTNNVMTFQLHSGAANGDTGAEIANATVLAGVVRLLVVFTGTNI